MTQPLLRRRRHHAVCGFLGFGDLPLGYTQLLVVVVLVAVCILGRPPPRREPWRWWRSVHLHDFKEGNGAQRVRISPEVLPHHELETSTMHSRGPFLLRPVKMQTPRGHHNQIGRHRVLLPRTVSLSCLLGLPWLQQVPSSRQSRSFSPGLALAQPFLFSEPEAGFQTVLRLRTC